MAGVIPRIVSREQALRIAERDPAGLLKIPAVLLDEDMFLSAVRADGMRLGYVPQKGRNRAVCEAAVHETGMALRFVPKKMLDREICLKAVQRTGLALRYVPPAFIDWNMAAAAVENDGAALAYVPEVLKDQDVCLMAVRNNASLAAVPKKERSRAVWLTALETGSVHLREVPAACLCRDAYLSAVRNDGSSLADVPYAMRTEEICRTAVARCGVALLFVPEQLKTREICLAAVRSFSWAIRYVPENLKGDREIAGAALCREDSPAAARNAAWRDGMTQRPVVPSKGSYVPLQASRPQDGRLTRMHGNEMDEMDRAVFGLPGRLREADAVAKAGQGPGRMASSESPGRREWCAAGKRVPYGASAARTAPAAVPQVPKNEQSQEEEGFAPSFW